jgi:import inner membrane translocase subunit TIM8
MSWFGFGGGKKEVENPPLSSGVSSFSDSGFITEDDPSNNFSSSTAPRMNVGGGGMNTSVQDVIIEEQQKALVQQAIAKITSIAWDKCSADKPGTQLSSFERSCMENVATSYLDASVFLVRKLGSAGR